uniref:Uncharacterized protein n=1 Tax=Spongospora subterranea TaxID=70186 RepID=A0A0H5QU27_9EUKA|eukprot:CRZ05071.1 hypothetical protein [Spongospora subterranea]
MATFITLFATIASLFVLILILAHRYTCDRKSISEICIMGKRRSIVKVAHIEPPSNYFSTIQNGTSSGSEEEEKDQAVSPVKPVPEPITDAVTIDANNGEWHEIKRRRPQKRPSDAPASANRKSVLRSHRTGDLNSGAMLTRSGFDESQNKPNDAETSKPWMKQESPSIFSIFNVISCYSRPLK